MGNAGIVVVTQDKEAVARVRSALTSRPVPEGPVLYGDLGQLKTWLSRPDANGDIQVAVVDIDADPDRTLFDLSGVIATHPKILFMVLATESNERLILRAMQAGARHFLRKHDIATELDTVLEHLLTQCPRATGRLGNVISVFSCSGGCGATTVAVNLANELRLLCRESVLIIDLDCHYGSVATHLGVTGDYGIAHILSRGRDIDSHLIETGAVHVTRGLDVLLSPMAATADGTLTMQWENLSKAVEACREVYRYVVIDAPRVPEQAAADLASASHSALVVFQLTVRDISSAKSTISFLTEHGTAADRIVPLANRVSRRGPLLRLREGERALGIQSLRGIRNDWHKALKSANQGKPIAEIARRSRLRRDFSRLAQGIHT